jgi:DNA recombination protein RmuC
METILIAIICVLVGGILAYFLLRSKKDPVKDDSAMTLLITQMNELARTLDARLGESNKQVTDTIRHQTSESQRVIQDITERLTRLDETNKQVMSFTDQLKSLQDILKNPKQRGILGEYYLETLLKNIMPPGSYQMQYPFPDGTIVDAAVL